MGVLVLGMWRDVVFNVYHSMAEFLWAWVYQYWECGEMLYLFFKFKQLFFSTSEYLSKFFIIESHLAVVLSIQTVITSGFLLAKWLIY